MNLHYAPLLHMTREKGANSQTETGLSKRTIVNLPMMCKNGGTAKQTQNEANWQFEDLTCEQS